jgi:multiple sugar transport system substrate-binding protein
MHSKKLVAAASSLFATALVLAGCTASGSSDDAADTSGASESTAAETTSVSMVLWPGPEGDAMQKVVDEYNANQGIEDGVEVEQILLSRDDTFSKEAALMKAESDEYDIYFTASYLIGQHAAYLSPAEGVDPSVYLAASVESLQVDGTQYGVPLDTSLHFMYYREDLVATLSDEANAALYSSIAQEVLGKSLTPNADPSTWDWDDAIATAAFFTQEYNPNSPTKYGYALPAKNLLYNTMIWNNLLWGLGGNWVDDSGQPAISSDAGLEAIELYATIYEKGLTSPDSAQWEYAETNAALTSGNAMMALQWNAAFSELSTTGETAGKLGIASPPGSGPRTHVHSLAVAQNKFSANPEASQKWLAYLATEEAMAIYAENGGVPSMPGILNGMVDSNASFANMIEYANEIGYSEPKVPREFDIYAALAEKLSLAWLGEESASAAAEAADAAMADLLK